MHSVCVMMVAVVASLRTGTCVEGRVKVHVASNGEVLHHESSERSLTVFLKQTSNGTGHKRVDLFRYNGSKPAVDDKTARHIRQREMSAFKKRMAGRFAAFKRKMKAQMKRAFRGQDML